MPTPAARCAARISNWPAGAAPVGRRPHAVDRRERQRRAGSPRSATAPPTRSGPRLPKSNRNSSNAVGELVAALVEPRQRPHRVARRGRVDLADAGDDRHDQVGPPDASATRADHPDRHGRHVRGEEVLGEQLAMHRQQVAEALPQLASDIAVRSGRRARSAFVIVAVVGQLGRDRRASSGRTPRRTSRRSSR